jgi:lipopolysaccharide/colanic/teichoic acid biosynthesis glycosyltransferase
MPIEMNLHRISHRIGKRLLDIAISIFALPISALRRVVTRENDTHVWKDILRGDLTLVGFASGEACIAYFGKPGLTSLAAIAAPRNARTEDIHQFDEYYARNHTLGMDCEILLKSLLIRKDDRKQRLTNSQ